MNAALSRSQLSTTSKRRTENGKALPARCRTLAGCSIRKMLLPIAAVLLSALPLQAQQASSAASRPKVAVVLSGGGVKGAAHVGVLRAVEEAGLPIDMVVGTSMGSIVGGLYCMGYSTAQLDSLFRLQDWDFLLSDQSARASQNLYERNWHERYLLTALLSSRGKPQTSGLLRGQNLGNLLSRMTLGYHHDTSFDELPTRFACVATNLADGSEVDIHSGVLATALRASMAIPGAFTPVVTADGTTLVDGGLCNNYPVDVARQMGADIVIGSTVQKTISDSVSFGSMTSVLDQLMTLMCRNKYAENDRDADLSLHIPVTDYSTLDFSAASIDTILARGYREAHAHTAELEAFRKRVFGNSSSEMATPRDVSLQLIDPSDTAALEITRVTAEGNLRPFEIRELRRLLGGKAATKASGTTHTSGSALPVSLTKIEQAMTMLREKFLYTDAAYSLQPDDETSGYVLHFNANERSKSRIGVGARFDTEEMATLLLGADLVLGTRIPSHLNLQANLSEQYAFTVAYTLEPRLNRRVGLAYRFRHADIDVYRGGHRTYNLTYGQHTLKLSGANLNVRNFSAEIGVKLDWFHFSDVVVAQANTSDLHNDLYFTAFLSLGYNSYDRAYYPNAGSRFKAETQFTTDNLSRLARPHAFTSLAASWETVIPLSSRWALLPALRGRVIWGTNVPKPFLNTFGGEMMGKYVDQQLPFTGVARIEPARDALFTAALRLRYNIAKNQYVTAIGNTAADASKLSKMHRASYIGGGGLQYGYLTKFGPIEGTVSYSDNTNHLQFFINVGYSF